MLRCRRPVDPSGIDTEQLAALETFFETHRGSGLVKGYDDDRSLEREVANILLLAVGRTQTDGPSRAAGPSLAGRLRCGRRRTRRSNSARTARGRLKTPRRDHLVLINRGDVPAYEVTFELEPELEPEADGATLRVIDADRRSKCCHPALP